jgi:long-chain acyl-CoA synthetase
LHQHKYLQLTTLVVGARSVLGNAIKPGDGLLAYLPLAHIIEFVFENLSLVSGSTLGYASPKTLTEISVRNCKGDLKEFKPTVMVGIPAVWESVKKGVIDQVNSSGFVVRGLFWAALSTKLTLTHWGLPGGGLIDSMVFSKVKDVAGGRLRFCMSGGGPIAQNTLRFISMALAPMISGYGLTETCGSVSLTCKNSGLSFLMPYRMGSLVDPSNWVDNAMGEIPASVEVKLVDVPDLDYSTDSKPYPQGEIWIRGGPVTEGYLDLDNETRESFENGWFKTGDIGEFEETGMLRIIDRKKNLVKTLNGEYIALEKVKFDPP